LLDQIVAHNFAASLVPRLVEIVPDVPALMAALPRTIAASDTRSDLL